jgi:hypothetical protein
VARRLEGVIARINAARGVHNGVRLPIGRTRHKWLRGKLG